MKNIIVFSDGTGQDGGKGYNTNVYKLFNLIVDRSQRQISFYDKGLGTTWRKKISGNLFGSGFSKNVRECYEFIFQNYQGGDKIFLFGFSRGAATVRSLSGFIHQFGILPKSREELIERAWKIYEIKNHNKRKIKTREFNDNNHTMWAPIQFLGVWDTVSALGVPNTIFDKLLEKIIPHGFHDYKLSESILNACHAVAIDDRRKSFHPILFYPHLSSDESNSKSKRSLKQVWFMGMHTDVGGGYDKKQLSDIPLEWMVQNAVKHGLLLFKHDNETDDRKDRVDDFAEKCDPNENGWMHSSIDKLWKRALFRNQKREWIYEKIAKPMVHKSVTLRTSDTKNNSGEGYTPWILDLEYDLEPWRSSKDVINDPDYTDLDEKTLEVLKGWRIDS